MASDDTMSTDLMRLADDGGPAGDAAGADTRIPPPWLEDQWDDGDCEE